jgi:hypothetical protein
LVAVHMQEEHLAQTLAGREQQLPRTVRTLR